MEGISFFLKDEAATVLFGNDLSRAVKKGDLIAMKGDVGAGKTSLCRALIQSCLDDMDLDVPSPTYTLVQNYEGRASITHCDLYRLKEGSEVEELGLEEALEEGIVLVEWPEHAGLYLPPVTISIELIHEGEGRRIFLKCASEEAFARLVRTCALRDFLTQSGFQHARRRHFANDASSRLYELVEDAGGREWVVMDQRLGDQRAEAQLYRKTAKTGHETVIPFVVISTVLRAHGFASPQVMFQDISRNFLILEHLGTETLLNEAKQPIVERYITAAQRLAHIHNAPFERDLKVDDLVWQLPMFDHDVMSVELSLLLDWYVPYTLKRMVSESERAEFYALWHGLMSNLNPTHNGIVLRDYHSPNIIWRKHEQDPIGILDFQDALWGPNAYDVASLAQDARVSIGTDAQSEIVNAYMSARSVEDREQFLYDYFIMSLQRNSKILGIFIRLCVRDGKPEYRAHVARIEAYIRQTLAQLPHAPIHDFYAQLGLK